MALDTYPQLVAAVGDWLNRRDLAAQIPDFVRLCEDDLNSKLRDRRMHQTVDATVSGQPITLPDDWLEAVRVFAPGSGRPLLPASMYQLQSRRAHRRLGAFGVNTPELPTGIYEGMAYAITGNMLEVQPMPQQPLTLQMVYFQKLPRLSEDQLSNWLLVEDAALYLYGSLLQAEPYLRNDERVATWASMYADRITARNAASAAAEFSGGPLRRTRKGFGTWQG